jgi:hypothetical protein
MNISDEMLFGFFFTSLDMAAKLSAFNPAHKGNNSESSIWGPQ